MKTIRQFVAGAIAGSMLVLAGVAWTQSTNTVTTVEEYAITSYPLYGVAASQSDSANLTNGPGHLRADSAGAVTASCVGNGPGNQITVNLVAGEYFPCIVDRLYDTGTDAITIHHLY